MVEIIPNWHPIFVHFSVALLSLSVLLFVLTKLVTNWRLEDQWLATAYWNLWLGTLISIGTVLAGWIAFNSVEHDDPSHAAMLEHRLWALITFGFFVLMALWAIVQYKRQNPPSAIFVVLLVVGLAGLGGTAWHGGELVYRHGLGVMSLPEVDKHSHEGAEAHSHDAGDMADSGGGGHHDAVDMAGSSDGGHHDAVDGGEAALDESGDSAGDGHAHDEGMAEEEHAH